MAVRLRDHVGYSVRIQAEDEIIRLREQLAELQQKCEEEAVVGAGGAGNGAGAGAGGGAGEEDDEEQEAERLDEERHKVHVAEGFRCLNSVASIVPVLCVTVDDRSIVIPAVDGSLKSLFTVAHKSSSTGAVQKYRLSFPRGETLADNRVYVYVFALDFNLLVSTHQTTFVWKAPGNLEVTLRWKT